MPNDRVLHFLLPLPWVCIYEFATASTKFIHVQRRATGILHVYQQYYFVEPDCFAQAPDQASFPLA